MFVTAVLKCIGTQEFSSDFSILIYKDAGLISFQLPTASGLLPPGTAIHVRSTPTGVGFGNPISGAAIKL